LILEEDAESGGSAFVEDSESLSADSISISALLRLPFPSI